MPAAAPPGPVVNRSDDDAHSAMAATLGDALGDTVGVVVGDAAALGVTDSLGIGVDVGLDEIAALLDVDVTGLFEPPLHPVTAMTASSAQTGAALRTPRSLGLRRWPAPRARRARHVAGRAASTDASDRC